MKAVIFSILFVVTIARGALVNQAFTENTAIPDGNPVGVSFTETFNQDPNAGDIVGELTLTLNVSGGYNGDPYAYLTSSDGTTVTLVNQPGVSESDPFGYGGAGFNVTLSDSASTSIQTTPETDGIAFTGTYQAAGNLADCNGSPVDGAWTLYFADESSGGGTAMLNSWSLNISAVPEPEKWGLYSALGLLAICGLRLWKETRRRRHKRPH